jgi:hypothetical protein
VCQHPFEKHVPENVPEMFQLRVTNHSTLQDAELKKAWRIQAFLHALSLGVLGVSASMQRFESARRLQ